MNSHVGFQIGKFCTRSVYSACAEGIPCAHHDGDVGDDGGDNDHDDSGGDYLLEPKAFEDPLDKPAHPMD